MKIVEQSGGTLTNFEVVDLLRSRGAGTEPTRPIASISLSEFKVFDYLEQTVACNQTREIINKLGKKFDLADAEILNIANLRPTTEPQIYSIIEDYDSRIGDKETELIETITQILPPLTAK